MHYELFIWTRVLLRPHSTYISILLRSYLRTHVLLAFDMKSNDQHKHTGLVLTLIPHGIRSIAMLGDCGDLMIERESSMMQRWHFTDNTYTSGYWCNDDIVYIKYGNIKTMIGHHTNGSIIVAVELPAGDDALVFVAPCTTPCLCKNDQIHEATTTISSATASSYLEASDSKRSIIPTLIPPGPTSLASSSSSASSDPHVPVPLSLTLTRSTSSSADTSSIVPLSPTPLYPRFDPRHVTRLASRSRYRDICCLQIPSYDHVLVVERCERSLYDVQLSSGRNHRMPPMDAPKPFGVACAPNGDMYWIHEHSVQRFGLSKLIHLSSLLLTDPSSTLLCIAEPSILTRLYDNDTLKKALPRDIVTLIGDYTLVRKVVTIAGGTAPGWRMVDGTGSTAFLCAPACVIVHPDGKRLVILDYGGQCVRIVHLYPDETLPNGVPSTYLNDIGSLSTSTPSTDDTFDLFANASVPPPVVVVASNIYNF
jgi:hypothetical protein